MTRTKTTKRALLLSALSLLLCVSMLIGSTFAWFTDEVKSGNNQIVAGNLDVELEYNKVVNGQLQGWKPVKGATEIFDPNALWEPGRVEVVYLRITNLGTLALKYQLGVNIIDETPGINVDGDPFKLSDYLVFKTVEMPDGLTTYTDRQAVEEAAGTQKGLTDYNGKTATLEAKNADATSNFEDYVALIVYMPETVDNDANYRGDAIPTINLGVNLFATQKDFESDSFGPDYDEDAWHNSFKVYSAQDLQAAINNGETNITLMENIEAAEAVVIPAGANVALNLNGKTLSNPASYVFENKGNLVITGNGTFTGLGGIRSTAGSVTIENGNFYFSSRYNDNNYQHTLKAENSVVEINGGNFDATINGQNNAMLNASTNAVITINGGSFKNVAGELAKFDPYLFTYEKNGKVIINDGTFYGGWRFNGETATTDIYGGNFTVGFDGQSFNASSTHVVTIYGGNFVDGADAKLTAKVKENELLAAGYQAIANGDGTYTVLPVVEGDTLTAVAGYPGVYSGTKAKTYYVSGANGLVNATELMNTITTGEGQSATFTLMGNVDMAGKTWKPIDKMWVNFDGNGYTISNLTAEAWKAGFFGYLGGGEIKNLTLENVNVTGAQVGAFAGSIEGKITNCYLKGDNTITWAPKYQFEDPNGTLEAWNGIGAITGVAQDVTVNAEIVAGATVTLNKAGFVTVPDCTFVDNLTGYINANKGTVVNNGQISVGVSTIADLEQIVNSGADVTVALANDLVGNITIMRNPGADVIIDGNENTFTGTMTIIGNTDTGSLTIKDVNFVAASGSKVAIDCPAKYNNGNANNYVKNVTIDNCTFTDPDNSRDCVAVNQSSGGKKYWTLKNCTVDSTMHSFVQFSNVENSLVIEGCKVYSKNGVNLNYGTVLTMTDCTFDVTGYAVRFGVGDATVNGNYTMDRCNLKSANDDGDAVIIFRGTMTGSTLTLTETTLTGTPDITNPAGATVVK